MNISSAEMQLLDILWSESPLTVGQIIQRAQEKSDWHANTIKTMLTRLTNKGAVERKADGKRYFYSPGVTRNEIVKEETNGFLSRFFDGKVAPLLAHFADNQKVSADELKEIEKILAKLKKNND